MDSYREIAPFYDCEHADFREDVEFYLQLVRQDPVLEVGVGTGRVALPLAEAGLKVWGIDSSRAMLEIARERLDRFDNVTLVETSVEELCLETTFRTVLFPLNALWHLPDLAAQQRALSAVRGHLTPGALLVLASTNPLALADRGSDGEVRQRFDRVCDGRRVTGYSAAWDDAARQVLKLALIYDVSEHSGSIRRYRADLKLRYLYRYELQLLLELAGFRIEQVYGSYALDPYDALSSRLIVVATLGEEGGKP